MTQKKSSPPVGTNQKATENGVVAFLHDTEIVFVRMTHGIFAFFVERLPIFFRAMLDWLGVKFVLCIRIVARLFRVITVMAIWLAMVFGPLVLYPGVISGVWMILALSGSIYGLQRHLKKRSTLAKPSSTPGELLEFLRHGK